MGICQGEGCEHYELLIETARRINHPPSAIRELPRAVQELRELEGSVDRAVKSEALCECGHYVLSHNRNGCFTLNVREGGVHTPCGCTLPHGNWTSKPKTHREALRLLVEYLAPLADADRSQFLAQLHAVYCAGCGRPSVESTRLGGLCD